MRRLKSSEERGRENESTSLKPDGQMEESERGREIHDAAVPVSRRLRQDISTPKLTTRRPFELGPPLRQTAVRKLSPDALPSRHAGGQTTHERTTWGSTATLTERARDGRADGPSTNAPAVAGGWRCVEEGPSNDDDL
ncbi:uncharacterized protein [Dermacentor andersoni]|uniref:uncharacterized protein isoform X2 n=1 Tax=Dermacentor andersoni TaxID=34620 RepID=UPI00241645AD|nr:uncharacterized protein LOC129385277 isoform X3 [Dermacentor andersoni]